MSQSWDNVARMHDQYMLTKHRDIVHAQTVSYLCKIIQYHVHACANGTSMNFEPISIIAQATPLTASGCSGSNLVCNDDVFTLLKRRYRTTDRYDKEQTSPLASLEAQWLAPGRAPA